MTASPAERLGLSMAAASAACYALSAVMAGLAFSEGNEPGTLVTGRFLTALLLAYPLVLWRGRPLALPAGALLLVAGVVAGSLGTAGGYMAAIRHMPVSLAVLVFYTYPLVVTIGECVLQRRPPGLRLVVALLLGFVGLGLALGADLSALTLAGFGYGLLASASCTLLFLCGRRLTAPHATLALFAHVNLACFVLMLSIVLAQGALVLPVSLTGWGGLLASCLAFAAAFLLQLQAVKRAPPEPAALIYNAEPLITILVAWLFLGQLLSGLQWLGVGLVLTALFLLVGRKG